MVREWKRHDLAVLHRSSPVALIEAKAAMSFNLMDKKLYPRIEMLDDIEKLRQAVFDGERFVPPIFTHNRQVPQREYEAKKVITYAYEKRKHGVIETGSVCQGLNRFRKVTGDVPVVAQGEVPAGKAFGIDVSVFYLLLAVTN